MLFKQCLNAVLIGIGHLVLGIKMYRKKHTVVFFENVQCFSKNVQCFFKNIKCFFQNNGMFFRLSFC